MPLKLWGDINQLSSLHRHRKQSDNSLREKGIYWTVRATTRKRWSQVQWWLKPGTEPHQGLLHRRVHPVAVCCFSPRELEQLHLPISPLWRARECFFWPPNSLPPSIIRDLHILLHLITLMTLTTISNYLFLPDNYVSLTKMRHNFSFSLRKQEYILFSAISLASKMV